MIARAAPAPSPGADRYQRVATATLGHHRGAARLYLQGVYLARAGFAPATRIEAHFAPGRVRIRRAPAGTRVVSSKARRGSPVPVIDLHTARLQEAFGEVSTVRVRISEEEIEITAARTARRRLTRCRNGGVGSMCSGAGLLDEAARLAGLTRRWGVEIDPSLAELFEANAGGARLYNQSVADVELDELEPVEVFVAGISCKPWSRLLMSLPGTGRRRDPSEPREAHPEADLALWILRAVDALNPAYVIVEQVPLFLSSGAGYLLLGALSRMGYQVEARVVSPIDYGYLADRPRAVIAASSDPGPVRWPRPSRGTQRLADILDPAEALSRAWFTRESKPWFFDHRDTQSARGNGFAGAVLYPDADRVPTLTAGYFRGQGGNFVIADPNDPGRVRWMTLSEARRLLAVPPGFQLGSSVTLAGEALGQAVHVDLFRRLIACITGRAHEGGPEPAEAPMAAPARGPAAQLDFSFTAMPHRAC